MKYLVTLEQIQWLMNNVAATAQAKGIEYDFLSLDSYERMLEEPYDDWRDEYLTLDAAGDEVIHVDKSRDFFVYRTKNGVLNLKSRNIHDYLLSREAPQPITRWAVMNAGQLDTWLFESERSAQESVDRLNKNGNKAKVVKFEGEY